MQNETKQNSEPQKNLRNSGDHFPLTFVVPLLIDDVPLSTTTYYLLTLTVTTKTNTNTNTNYLLTSMD